MQVETLAVASAAVLGTVMIAAMVLAVFIESKSTMAFAPQTKHYSVLLTRRKTRMNTKLREQLLPDFLQKGRDAVAKTYGDNEHDAALEKQQDRLEKVDAGNTAEIVREGQAFLLLYFKAQKSGVLSGEVLNGVFGEAKSIHGEAGTFIHNEARRIQGLHAEECAEVKEMLDHLNTKQEQWPCR